MWKCEALNIDGRKGITMVAVKTLKESASNKEREDLVAELNLMKTLLNDSHPNVVRLLGCCTSSSEKGNLVLVCKLTPFKLILFRSNLCHHGICVKRKTSRFPKKVQSRTLLWKFAWFKSETHFKRFDNFLLSSKSQFTKINCRNVKAIIFRLQKEWSFWLPEK